MPMVPTLPTDSLYKLMAVAGLVLVVAAFFGPMQAEDDLEAEIHMLDLEFELLSLEGEEIDRQLASAWDRAWVNEKSAQEYVESNSELDQSPTGVEEELDAAVATAEGLWQRVEKKKQEHGSYASETLQAVAAFRVGLEDLETTLQTSKETGDSAIAENEDMIAEVRAEFDSASAELSEIQVLLRKHQRKWIEVKHVDRNVRDLIERETTYSRLSAVGMVGGLLLGVLGFWMWFVKVQKPMDKLLAARANNGTEKTDDSEKDLD